MGKIQVICSCCGKIVERYPSQVSPTPFCSRACAKSYTSARMHDWNETSNPKNTPGGWDTSAKEATRAREQRNKGPCKKDTYPKLTGGMNTGLLQSKSSVASSDPERWFTTSTGTSTTTDPKSSWFSQAKKNTSLTTQHIQRKAAYIL